jgi:GNAT superfamily N-acetyltransferase
MTEAGIWKIYSYTNMERDLAIHNSSYYFVQYQSQTIGILKLIENIPLAEFKNRKSAKLDRIYLDPEFHGQGIGKTLLDWTEKISSKWSFPLWLEAIDTQKKAVLFMKK